jgi:hypothetical protein
MKAVYKNMAVCSVHSNLIDIETVFEVRKLIESFEESRWITRNILPPTRGLAGETCRYAFCGHAQMPKNAKDRLKELAPEYKDYLLAEIAVNRYKPGDYIGKHRDRDFYRRNLVIALQANGDGLQIDNPLEFIEDVAGQGVLIEGVGPVHSVPPVNQTRYCLIYLYE